MDTIGLVSVFLAIVLSCSILAFRIKRARPAYVKDPPGPRGIPLFGNEFQIPKDKQWLKFDEWSKTYGDVVRITTMGQPVIILSSFKAAFDLLESRGSIYSGRPHAVMAGELVGWNKGLGYAQYGERFKEFRRMFHQIMGPRPAQDLQSLQERETVRLMRRLLRQPQDFIKHARQSTGAVIVKIAYGYDVVSDDDPIIKIAEEAMCGFAKASEPGAFMVDRFPFLKYMPRWMPGSGFLRIADKMRADLEHLYDVPFEFVRLQIKEGKAPLSFTSKYLVEKESSTESEQAFVKAAAASLYSGGADTTPSSISSFILAMVLYPHVQDKGQDEIDSVVGKGRLPNFADRESLPYVNAIVKEILRWNPSVPLGLPHQLQQDDIYGDFFLPKGSIIWANLWSILHNEKYFPNPYCFDPERFLNPKKEYEKAQDPAQSAFGFGRRICPGLHLADNSIFITVAYILTMFRVSRARDENGEEVLPIVEYRGFISHPVPFRCDIRPRSEAALTILNEQLDSVQDSA